MNWLILFLALWPHADDLNHRARLAVWEISGRRGPEPIPPPKGCDAPEFPSGQTWILTEPGKGPRRIR
jgi:hypothetical protein